MAFKLIGWLDGFREQTPTIALEKVKIMKTYIPAILCVGFMLLLMQDAFAQQALPISRQATMVERTSSADVMIEATGIYNSSETRDRRIDRDLNDNGVTEATKDAKKAAVWFILNGTSDPMLDTPGAQNNFRPHESYFYDLNNINQWITWEQSGLVNRVRTSDGAGLQIIKRFRLDTDMIKSELERFHVIRSGVELSDATGRPSIVLLPHAPEGKNPIELLRDDTQIRHAASVAKSFLTLRQYDVVVPEQHVSVGGQAGDYAHRFAQHYGSDIYITYSGTLEDAGFGTQRMAMHVRAYETTTARLLDTAIGYSQGRRGESPVSAEEAMNDALNKVLQPISNYWINAGR